jgi:hypothetical protein
LRQISLRHVEDTTSRYDMFSEQLHFLVDFAMGTFKVLLQIVSNLRGDPYIA